MPSHPAQWIKKKGRRRPYKHGDFTCKPMYVVTACSHINLVFDMEKKLVGASKKIFEKLFQVGLDDPWLLDLAEITEAFYAKLQTSDMHEFLGDHGKPANMWPTIEMHDNNFLAVKRTPH